MSDKIIVSPDLTIVKGYHAISDAVFKCGDLSAFQINVVIFDGVEHKNGIMYFDTKLNRFSLKKTDKIMYVIYQGYERKIYGVFDTENLAGDWCEALNNAYGNSDEKYFVKKQYLNLVNDHTSIINVKVVKYDLSNNARVLIEMKQWPRKVSDNITEIQHKMPDLNAFESEIVRIDRYITIISNLDNHNEKFAYYRNVFNAFIDTYAKKHTVRGEDENYLYYQRTKVRENY